MKAQTSLFIKGIYLIIILVAISIFSSQILSFSASSAAIEKETAMAEKATAILQLISTSPTCLGYKEENELSGPISSVAQKVLDIHKIEDFSKKYESIEPVCARDYENGYEILVKMFGSKLDTTKRSYSVQEKTWRFGSPNFSEDTALKKMIEISLPVSIRINASYQQPGEIKIKFVEGELEEFSGSINKVCDTGIPIRKRISFSYTTFVDEDNVCQKLPFKVNCRKISCEARGPEFPPGSYEIALTKEVNIVEVR